MPSHLAFIEHACHVPWPSSLKSRSRFVSSFSFFPRRRFLPPFPLFLGIVVRCRYHTFCTTRSTLLPNGKERVTFKMMKCIELRIPRKRIERETQLIKCHTCLHPIERMRCISFSGFVFFFPSHVFLGMPVISYLKDLFLLNKPTRAESFVDECVRAT